jgi:hypothetical protein
MNREASDWLAFVTLALFCGSILYGGVAIRTLLN